MSVYGKGRNEIAAVHLIKSNCVPVLTYAFWNLAAVVSRAS